MRILITGAKGFVGKNLVATLKNIRDGKDKTTPIDSDLEIFEYDIDSDVTLLDSYCKTADFVFHLAGVNRPETEAEFMEGNFGFTSVLLEKLEQYKNTCPVMISSSIQAALDNPYGRSKKAGEDLMFDYAKRTGSKVLVYRFPNLFGKWCRPNYNSVIATFCHNVAHGLPIQVNDPSVTLNLVYVDDLVAEMLLALQGKAHMQEAYAYVPMVHTVTLGKIAELIQSFKESRESKGLPNFEDGFEKKLYSTYLSYLPEDSFSYPLKMNLDARGSFTEFIRTPERGQVSINISKPGIVKGNHWHHTKNEKFLVVSGKGVIRFRKIDTNDIIEYHVSGDKLEVVDIPCGYTHNIENLGDTEMVTVMWCNECFDPERPDTYFLEV